MIKDFELTSGWGEVVFWCLPLFNGAIRVGFRGVIKPTILKLDWKVILMYFLLSFQYHSEKEKVLCLICILHRYYYLITSKYKKIVYYKSLSDSNWRENDCNWALNYYSQCWMFILSNMKLYLYLLNLLILPNIALSINEKSVNVSLVKSDA